MATDNISIEVDKADRSDEKPSAQRFSSNSPRSALDLQLMAADDASIPITPNTPSPYTSSPSNSSTHTQPQEVMATEISISIDKAVEGQSDNIAWPHTSFSPSNSNAHRQHQEVIMGTEIISISKDEAVYGQYRNIAWPRPQISSSPSNSNTHMQPQARSNNSNNTSNPKKKSLAEDLIQLSKTTSDPNSWSIFRVPYLLRQVNEKAYEPRVISIGPYYHGKEHLKLMEIIKESCLSKIIRESMGRAKEFVRAMKYMEEDVRKCYPEALDHIASDAFVKMMILDGCFIVDLFQNDYSSMHLEQNGILSEIYCDLLLLENQLPFSVLCKLYGMINMSNDEMDEFARLALSHLSQLVPGPVIFPKRFSKNIKHLLSLVHDGWIPQHHTKVQGQGTLSKFIRCARELEVAGIEVVKKDKKGKDEEGVATLLFDIEFTDDAKLKIPTLHIHDNTERILRNFMAYEQFIPIWEPTYVCDYVVFMDNLIDSGKDVQLLRHSGVIVNWLGDDEAVAQMFNKLRDFTYSTQHSFYYKEMYDEVDNHCQRKWNEWKAKLRTDYFNSPWSLISVIAAVVLLLLTIVQTILSVLSYVQPL